MKIGIYGGAFDPVHSEHLKIIAGSQKALGLDKVLLLLSYSPPHKNVYISDFFVRKRMLEIATADLPFVEIEIMEFYRNREKNCSFEVLAELKEKYRDDELIYIIGGDSLEKFHTWIHPEIIAKLMPIAICPRKGYDNLIPALEYCTKTFGMNGEILPFCGEDISSSLLKTHYELDIPLAKDNIPDKVDAFIRENKLYSHFSEYYGKLSKELDEEKLIHTKGVVLFGVEKANQLYLNYEKVFLSCLLHDCAKRRKDVAGKYADIEPKVVHQFLGADIAREEYGITDEDILNAIRYHTTGKPNMTTLEKLVYSADMLEMNRDFDGVERLREIMEENFERGFVECIKCSTENLLQRKKTVYYLTLDCYKYYINQ